MNCPCGRSKNYSECCKVAHDNPMFIKTAEDLMRSRYTAFTMSMGDYLIDTHHAATCNTVNKEELVNWSKSVKWLRLEITNVIDGGELDDMGTVEFKAHFKERSKSRYIHEKSIFKREFGVWKYFGAVQ